MNGFKKHGIERTSASQLNMWAESPSAWVAKYLCGARFPFGVAPLIGILVENVVARTLLGEDFESALECAEKRFRKETALNTSEKDCARISNIKDMAELAIDQLKPYGVPEFPEEGQEKIELLCKGDGWELPVVGYLDFVYPEHGLVIDLKTTLRMPSVMSAAHERQAAIYQKAKGNYGVKFLYVTPKKSALLEVDNVNAVLDDIKTILNRKEKLLRAMSKEELIGSIPINKESFFWKNAEHIYKDVFA
jgi:hypothetical protein